MADAQELLARNVGNCATLEDYRIFLESALCSWTNYKSLALEAAENG